MSAKMSRSKNEKFSSKGEDIRVKGYKGIRK